MRQANSAQGAFETLRLQHCKGFHSQSGPALKSTSSCQTSLHCVSYAAIHQCIPLLHLFTRRTWFSMPELRPVKTDPWASLPRHLSICKPSMQPNPWAPHPLENRRSETCTRLQEALGAQTQLFQPRRAGGPERRGFASAISRCCGFQADPANWTLPISRRHAGAACPQRRQWTPGPIFRGTDRRHVFQRERARHKTPQPQRRVCETFSFKFARIFESLHRMRLLGLLRPRLPLLMVLLLFLEGDIRRRERSRMYPFSTA